MASSSVLRGRDDPVLDGGLPVANHHHGRVELAGAHRAGPEELAVLRALGLGFEDRRVARGRCLVRGIRVTVAVAGARAEAPILEDERVGVAGRLAALEENTLEAAPVEVARRERRRNDAG